MPRAVEDLTGMEFGNGMVKVISRADNGNTRHAKWLCQCECGKIFVEYALNLKAGRRNSCGCLSKRKPTDSISLPQKSRVKAEKTKIFFQKASSGFGDVSFKERSGRFKA